MCTANYQVVKSEASLDKLPSGLFEHAPTPLGVSEHAPTPSTKG